MRSIATPGCFIEEAGRVVTRSDQHTRDRRRTTAVAEEQSRSTWTKISTRKINRRIGYNIRRSVRRVLRLNTDRRQTLSIRSIVIPGRESELRWTSTIDGDRRIVSMLRDERVSLRRRHRRRHRHIRISQRKRGRVITTAGSLVDRNYLPTNIVE